MAALLAFVGVLGCFGVLLWISDRALASLTVKLVVPFLVLIFVFGPVVGGLVAALDQGGAYFAVLFAAMAFAYLGWLLYQVRR